ncbi:3-phosphoshikimate 1-carboxyvinyltransferase [Acaricomes phytoseiuli]|uniref:3-phosphoshikimate 1-carboxyvinyltransferase n=1 Tax=Acaricomes phytoseiuli TaxID=291968 RepID=UPI000379C85E|nr:3-phosphoshikimate 1-carboxyvinyltransferase [Acaricomes phytoseiuli]
MKNASNTSTPHSGATQGPPAELWDAPVAERPVDATVSVPGSKSLTNRYLVLAAIADSPSLLRSPLRSRDSGLMITALRALGARIEELPAEGSSGSGPDLRITPIPAGHQAGDVTIDCGLAGTVMRFVPPLAALVPGRIRFDGDEHARLRPMAGLLDGLRALGIQVEPAADGVQEQALPFLLEAEGTVRGGRITIDASASSQFVSALLLAAPRFERGIHLEHRGAGLPSPEHIAMTVKVLRDAGAEVDDSTPGHWIVQPAKLPGFDIRSEPDLSNAGPFLAAALVSGGRVRITDWPETTTQIGDSWQKILTDFGAEVSLVAGVLEVRGGNRIRGVDLADTSELAPTVAALCALADSPSRLRGIGHLRGHETDRLAALVTEINRLGGDAEETPDGLIIRPRRLHGGVFRSYADHRMATAGAIIGLAVPGVQVENIATTAKTMPDFPCLWQQMLGSE